MLKNYDGYPVAVTEKNPSGPRLIVLLHGFGASTFSWRTVIDELAELGHVIAYDRPGFGVTPLVERTPTDDPYSLAGQVRLLGKLVEAESAGRPVVLVGHSAGALVATQFVLENPEVASALVLESPAIWRKPPVPTAMASAMRRPALEKLGDRLLGSFDKAGMKILTDSFFDTANLTQEIIDGYRAPMNRPEWRIALWRFMTADQTNRVRDQLGELNLPVFVISGEADRIVKVEDTFRVAERIPGHRIYLVPKAGHLAHEEQPADFLRVAKKYITGATS